MNNQTQRKMSQSPGLEEVEEAIGHAGYPLELRVSARLDEAGFSPIPSWTWWDARTSTEREVDVVASAYAHEGVTIGVHLLVECKRWVDGAVLFEAAPTAQQSVESGLSLERSHFWGQPTLIRRMEGSPALTHSFDRFGWTTEHWREAPTVAYQYGLVHRGAGDKKCRLSQQDADKTNDGASSSVHKSIDGLCRSLAQYRKEFGQVAPDYPDGFLNFAALLVVVEGPLYVHRIGRNGAPAETKPIDRATYYRRFHTPDGHRLGYRVDFMRETELPRVLGDLSDARAKMAASVSEEEMRRIAASVLADRAGSFAAAGGRSAVARDIPF